jgi:hypothetical protein
MEKGKGGAILMAIAGGGTPAVRVYIHLRRLVQQYPQHNVDASVIRTPEEAAVILAAGGTCYVETVGDAQQRTWALLEEMGLVDPLKGYGQ